MGPAPVRQRKRDTQDLVGQDPSTVNRIGSGTGGSLTRRLRESVGPRPGEFRWGVETGLKNNSKCGRTKVLGLVVSVESLGESVPGPSYKGKKPMIR